MPKVSMPALRKGEGLTVDAEHLSTDEEKNELVAQGHVTIARAGSLLTADEVRINRDTQRAEAKGNVQFTDPQGTIQASGFAGNLEDETGELTDGTVYLSSNHLTISGEKIEKSFGQTYHIENGEFTTCQCGAGAPSWSIAGKSVDITLDGYGLVDRPRLKVLETPILYLPYFSFPAKKTRQTGLLSPLYGYSKKRGFTYLQPIYVALNKSVDFTVAPDIATSARLGVIGEVRYAIDERSKGIIDVSYFNEFLRNNANQDVIDTSVANPTIPQNRWSVTADIRQDLPFELRGFVDSLAVSDDFFLREIPTASFDPEYARSLRTSLFDSTRAGLYRYWDHATLISQVHISRTSFSRRTRRFRRFPQLQFFTSDRFLDRHLKLGMSRRLHRFRAQARLRRTTARPQPSSRRAVPLEGVSERQHRPLGTRDGLSHEQHRSAAAGHDRPRVRAAGRRRHRRLDAAREESDTRALRSSTRRSARSSPVSSTSAASTCRSSSIRSSPKWTISTFPTSTRTIFRPTTSSTRSTAGTSSPTGSRADCSPSSTVLRTSIRVGRFLGDLNSFSGVTPSPFGDEDQRGGLAVARKSEPFRPDSERDRRRHGRSREGGHRGDADHPGRPTTSERNRGAAGGTDSKRRNRRSRG